MIGKLFEDWLQSGEDWGRSSLVLNHTMTRSQRRKGRYVMKTFRDLKQMFGTAVAKDIRQRKKELGAEWWWEHPDLPDNEEPHGT